VRLAKNACIMSYLTNPICEKYQQPVGPQNFIS